MRGQRAAVLRECNLEHAPHAAREHHVQIAPEAGELRGHTRREARGARAVTAPGIGGVAVTRAVAPLGPRLASLRQQVIAKPIEHAADAVDERVGADARLRIVQDERAQLLREQCEARVQPRTVGQERLWRRRRLTSGRRASAPPRPCRDRSARSLPVR